ncbi:nucleotidyl transferase AbiEii/AbiGii toxin family protein [Streptomyces sp. NPDC001380]|uniref:nucleotidyl transferase AbiEii/AbiGii toxin family protein n=1 Tax=Streptomyces sp. NPDC001380 TaxID=3364566 RepID=UPI0036C27F87
MGKTYASPTAFQSALKTAAQRMAKQHGMSISELVNIFYFNRLAARVFAADPDGWLIKGGQALLVRYEGAARLSGDIDLQCASPERTVEEAAALLIEAASEDLGGDFLRFAPTKFAGHSEEGRGGAQYFQVYIGTKKAATVKVDLVVGRTLAGTPETRTLKSAVDLEWPVDWPQVRLYPVIDHVADKICAMYERHGPNGSNRYRDLADLLLISQQETIDGDHAHQALHREAERRRQLGNGTTLVLPGAFQPPGPDWHAGYPKQADLVLGLCGCRTFPEAAQAAAAFIDPLLDGSVKGHWSPAHAAWQ